MTDRVRARPQRAFVGVVAVLALAGRAAAQDPPPPPVVAPSPVVPLDSRVGGGVDARVPSPGCVGGPVREKAVPYRVEDGDGRPCDPWDLPPEVPDARDFEEVGTFDEIADRQWELRERIWSTPEDLVSTSGFSHYGGLGHVPFWGRNTIRYGRWSLVPFAAVEAVWQKGLGAGTDDDEEAFEVVASAGALAEWWAPGGRTKVRLSLRGDYRWYDDVYEDAWTYVGGAAVEHRLSTRHTVEVGGEAERARRAFDLDTTLGDEDGLFERYTVFANGRWDRFGSDCGRLEGGVAWSWVDEVDGTVAGGDWTELVAWARYAHAIMRHEGFAYVEGRYETRDAEEDSGSSDLEHAWEARAGVMGVLPQARTRRLVGNAWVGYRWERYDAGPVGAGEDEEADLLTLGADLTYRPTPYTSGFLGFQRTNAFSAVANYNTVDTVTLAVTQNLTHRWVGRLAGSVARVQPQGQSDSVRVALGAGLRFVVSDNVDLTADYEYSHRFEGAGFDDADGHRAALGVTLHLR